MIKNIIGILSVILLSTSCSSEVFVDNPSIKDIKITVKGKKLIIKAKSFEKIKISKGINNVLAINSDGDTLLNKGVDFFDDGILNISQTKYAIWKDVFCEAADYETFKEKLAIKDTVVIDGLEFIDIDLVVKEQVFIPKNWDLSLDKKMPETVEIADNEKFKIISKIYRINELKEKFNYYGDYDFKDLTEEEINKILKNSDFN